MNPKSQSKSNLQPNYIRCRSHKGAKPARNLQAAGGLQSEASGMPLTSFLYEIPLLQSFLKIVKKLFFKKVS